MSNRNVTRRIVKSFGLAAVLVASMLAGFAGTANAQAIAANVVVDMSSVGTFDQTPGQSWIWLYKVADHGMYTGTVQTALKSGIDIGKPGNHELAVNGNLFRGSADAGDFLVVAHLGPKTLVMSKIETIADGNQYPNQTHVMTWSGSGTSANTGAAKPATKTGTTAKSAVPVGTAMCLYVTTAPITTTKTAKVTVGDVGDTFVGKMLFVLKGKAMTVEETLAAYAKNPKLGMERDFSGLAPATPVSIGSGNWAVFRIRTADGKRVYMGDLDASPNGSYAKLTRVDGVCEPFDLKLMGAKAATTGTATDIIGWLMAIGAAFGLAFVNRRRFPALSFNR